MASNVKNHLKRHFNGLPLIEAEGDLLLIVADEDFKGAKRKDAAHCVFAKTCQRQFHCSTAMFYRNTAYVDLPDKCGEPSVQRFILSPPAKQFIADFDRERKTPPRGSFLLKAPPKHLRLESKRRAEQKRKRKPEAKRRRKSGKRKIHLMDLDVRSGMGKVQATRQ